MTAPRPLRWWSFDAARAYAAQHVRGYPDWRVEQPVGRSHWQIALIPSATAPRYATRLDVGPANPAGVVVGDWLVFGEEAAAGYGQVQALDLDRRVAIVRPETCDDAEDIEVPLNPHDPDWTDDLVFYPEDERDHMREVYRERRQA